MSEQHFQEVIELFRKSVNPSKLLTREERHKLLFRLPPSEEDAIIGAKTSYPSRPSLIQGCLQEGAWKLTDDELNFITRGVSSGSESVGDSLLSFKRQQSPEIQALIDQVYESNDLADPDEPIAVSYCHKEQGYRKEQMRATRQLHRYRLVERRYLELLQDSIHKDKPSPEIVLKRRAFEQIMRETKGQVDFPRVPTNESVSRKIQDFAIKAQRRPYLDIGIWGFAVLRLDYSDDTAWKTYKSRLETFTQKVLSSSSVPENICQMLQFAYLEDNDALSGEVDQTKLVKYWKDNIWNEDIHVQINHDFFLSADLQAMDHDNPNDPLVYLHDASVEESSTRSSVFPGYIRLSTSHFCLEGIPGLSAKRQFVRSWWEILH